MSKQIEKITKISRLYLCKHLSDVTFTLPNDVRMRRRKHVSSNNSYDIVNNQDGDRLLTDSAVSFPVHKFVLSEKSDVFRAMFSGPLADNVDVVTIVDIDVEIMIEVLRYIYCNTVNLNGDTVFRCVYAAVKYNITDLLEQCSEFLIESIRDDNVCCIYEHAVFFVMASLKEACLKKIYDHAFEVMATDGFLGLTLNSLIDLIKSDDLMAEEIDVFCACIRWAKNKCKTNGIDTISKNIRKHLADVIYVVRFPVMTKNDIFERVIPTGILSKEEERELIDYLDSPVLTPLDFFINRERVGRFVNFNMNEFTDILCRTINTYGCNLYIECEQCSTEGEWPRLKAITGYFVSSVKQIYRVHEDNIKTLLEDYKIDLGSNTIIFSAAIEMRRETRLTFQTYEAFSYKEARGKTFVMPSGFNILTDKLHKYKIELTVKGTGCYIGEVPKGLICLTFLK